MSKPPGTEIPAAVFSLEFPDRVHNILRRNVLHPTRTLFILRKLPSNSRKNGQDGFPVRMSGIDYFFMPRETVFPKIIGGISVCVLKPISSFKNKHSYHVKARVIFY